MNHNQRYIQSVIRRYRRLALGGRLYWRINNRRRWLRSTFESDDVCVLIDSTWRMHFKSVKALVEFIEFHEIERNTSEK